MAESDDSAEKTQRERSPSFPFIPLAKAVDRAREMQSYSKYSARASNVITNAWKYTAKSSGGAQTVAALKAFGLLEDQGTGADRKISLTDLARRILDDLRPGAKEAALKIAALKPDIISSHWNHWGNDRPADAECWSELHLEKGFTKDAAQRFLSIYDQTISFAGLSEGAKMSDSESDQPVDSDPVPPERHVMSAEERIVFTQEIGPNQRVRILVSGTVDRSLLEAIDGYSSLQRKLIGALRTDNESQKKDAADQ